MDKYSKQAFKITLILFLAILGLFAFLDIKSIKRNSTNGIPKTAFVCDYGRKTRIWHWCWGLKWELEASLKVEYGSGQEYIIDYTCEGSGPNAYSDWSYRYYQSDISYQLDGNNYEWVKNWRSVQFYNDDYKVDATAWVTIYEDEAYSWDTGICVIEGGFLAWDEECRECC